MMTFMVSLMITTRGSSQVLGKGESAPAPTAHVLKPWSRCLGAAHLNPFSPIFRCTGLGGLVGWFTRTPQPVFLTAKVLNYPLQLKEWQKCYLFPRRIWLGAVNTKEDRFLWPQDGNHRANFQLTLFSAASIT